MVTWACVPAGVLIAIITTPSGHTLAQRPVARFTAVRFDVLSVGVDDLNRSLPESVRQVLLSPIPAETEVENLAEATRQAGFEARLLDSDALGNPLPQPVLSVVAPIHKESRIRVDELQNALNRAGVGLTVPQHWDRALIEIDMSAGIAADYGDIYLAQRLPLKLDAPQGFPVAEFFEVLFRIIGLNTSDAAYLRQKFATHPGDFLLVAPHFQLKTREVQLDSSPAVLLTQIVTQNFSPGRIYIVYLHC